MYNFYTNYASASNFSIPNPSSVCFWLTLRGFNAVMNNLFGTATNWRARSIVSSTKIEANINQTTAATTTSTFGTGTRIHLAFTQQRSTSGRVYVNAVEEANNSGSSTPTSPATLGIGNYGGGSDAANGDMEDIRIYDRILSAKEIQDIYYANGRDNIVSGLLNRWGATTRGNGQDMNGETIYDIAAGRLNGSISGTGAFYRGGFLNPRRRV